MDQNKGSGQQQGRRPGEEQFEPNQNANKEPAEGSREPGRGGVGGQNPGQPGGGITNRPTEREQQEQRDVPPRGEKKDEDRNA